VERAIVEFTRDDLGDWVALLECGHRQHVRHKPPFLERSWVLEAASRELWIGRPLDCRLCDQELGAAIDPSDEEGGDGPCMAGAVCAECGGVFGGPDGEGHRIGCSKTAERG